VLVGALFSVFFNGYITNLFQELFFTFGQKKDLKCPKSRSGWVDFRPLMRL
jgi:hypothetical protein